MQHHVRANITAVCYFQPNGAGQYTTATTSFNKTTPEKFEHPNFLPMGPQGNAREHTVTQDLSLGNKIVKEKI